MGSNLRSAGKTLREKLMKSNGLTAEIIESREFYNTLRNEVAPCMTVVGASEDGLLYFWDDFVSIFLLVGEHFVAVAYSGGKDPEGWMKLLKECKLAVSDHGKAAAMGSYLDYFASVNQNDGTFYLHGLGGHDWLGIYPRAKRHTLRRLYYRRPYWWPKSYQWIIDSLNRYRGPDDSVFTDYDHLRAFLSQVVYSMRFNNIAAAFDVQYGRRLPLDFDKLFSENLPVEILGLQAIEVRDDFRCGVDVQNGIAYLSECGANVDQSGQLSTITGSTLQVPRFGLAALAFLTKCMPDVTTVGQYYFQACLRSLPGPDWLEIDAGCTPEFERSDISWSQQVGSGMVLMTVLLEGMLGLGGNLYPSKRVKALYGPASERLCARMVCILEIQKRVIFELTNSESSSWIKR